MLRGRGSIPNSLPLIAVVVVTAHREYRRRVLFISFPANVRLCRGARLRERCLRWAVAGRQLAAETGRLVWCVVRHLRRRIAQRVILPAGLAGFVGSGHRRRSSVKGEKHGGGKTFLPENICRLWKNNKLPGFYMIFARKLTRFPKFIWILFAGKFTNFEWHLSEKYFFPEIWGRGTCFRLLPFYACGSQRQLARFRESLSVLWKQAFPLLSYAGTWKH